MKNKTVKVETLAEWIHPSEIIILEHNKFVRQSINTGYRYMDIDCLEEYRYDYLFFNCMYL